VPRYVFPAALSVAIALLALLPIDGGAQVAQSSPPVQQDLPYFPSPPIRDPQGLAIMQNALANLGGVGAISQVSSWSVQAQSQAASSGAGQTGSVVWMGEGPEFRVEFTGSTNHTIMVTGHGTPANVTNGAVQNLPPRTFTPRFLPTSVITVLASEYQNPGTSVAFAGTTTLGTEAVTVVQTSAWVKYKPAALAPETWYFDQGTGLPVRVEYRLVDQTNSANFIVAAVNLADYRAVSGILFPFQIVFSRAGQIGETITVGTIEVNVAIAASEFDPPTGGGQ
jgi:hypothetical protein